MLGAAVVESVCDGLRLLFRSRRDRSSRFRSYPPDQPEHVGVGVGTRSAGYPSGGGNSDCIGTTSNLLVGAKPRKSVVTSRHKRMSPVDSDRSDPRVGGLDRYPRASALIDDFGVELWSSAYSVAQSPWCVSPDGSA